MASRWSGASSSMKAGDCANIHRHWCACVFQAHVTADDFAGAVQKAAQGVWDDYGAHSYDEAWNGPNGFHCGA